MFVGGANNLPTMETFCRTVAEADNHETVTEPVFVKQQGTGWASKSPLAGMSSEGIQSWLKMILLITGMIGSLGLMGCSSTQSPRSKPPAIAVSFSQSFSVGDSASEMVFPSGRYLPVREDAEGFFFRAPEPVTVKDSLFGTRYRYEGGVYWKRSADAPEELYVKILWGKSITLPLLNPPDHIER